MRRRIGRSPKKRGRICPTGKTRFRDHTSAATAIAIAATGTRDVKPARAYECALCKGWHLTSQREER